MIKTFFEKNEKKMERKKIGATQALWKWFNFPNKRWKKEKSLNVKNALQLGTIVQVASSI